MNDTTTLLDGDMTGAQPAEHAVWPRAAFMVVFAILGAAGQYVLMLVAVLQGLWLLFAKAPNPQIARFAATLGLWQRDVAAYLGCASPLRPFPWADWPTAPR